MRKLLFAFLLAVVTFGPILNTAQACPMCKEANQTDENRPKAYMYSILFMMSMPAILFTGFSVGLYRLHRKQANEELDDLFSDPSER